MGARRAKLARIAHGVKSLTDEASFEISIRLATIFPLRHDSSGVGAVSDPTVWFRERRDMTERNVDFYFDFTCPYAYLASTRIEALARRTGANLTPKPIVLGGIFQARNVSQVLFKSLGPQKKHHNEADLRRQANLWHVPMSFPAQHPQKSITALRSLLVVGEPFMPLAHRFFEAYWVRGINIENDDGVRQILREAGYDADAVLAATQNPEIKNELRERTDEAVTLGVFGVPTFHIDGLLFWGQDRMDYVERSLGGTTKPLPPPPESTETRIDFYFDFSSPFSYIGAARAEAILGPSVHWRPFLLGGLFKSIGTAIVPLFEQSQAKQQYLLIDAQRQAEHARIPFRWPSRFPMNTVLPLRVALAAGGGNDPSSQQLVQRI
ncbi:MAG: hypothetical protein CMH54_11250, partial [Myxococcales bacterium]|nr:hypothetical protein [Myxococcales bacterium]